VVSSVPPAKFFVNRGIVSSRTDLLNVLRPLEKQTVAYRYYRGHELVQHGLGWVERIVSGEPETSTFFTSLSICLNVDSFEHLEFDTRPDQLLTYRLVQGDEAVVIDFAPAGVSALLQVRRARHEHRHGTRAGLTTFMVMAYIIFVNPSILGAGFGLKPDQLWRTRPRPRSSPAS
jgi:hypothetical protein